MDKKSAIHLIEDTFNAKFDENRFTLFIKNFLNDIEPKSNNYSGNYIWDDHKEHINAYKRIGKYIDPEGDALDVLIVEVKSVAKLERARTALRNFVIKHLSKFDKDYALVAFYSKEDDGTDWRFSFIKLEHQAYLDEEKQKVKTRKEFTPAKRYSFLVGKYEKAHTAKTQILPLLQNIANNPTIEEIENAFSIEKVTDEFFGQYKDLYVKLYEHFENDTYIQSELAKANIDNTRFTKKLLGQIVFLYFLQKKGWLGVPQNEHWGKGNKRFMQFLFEEAQRKDLNYFKDYLQPLFYEALAKERNNENSYYKRFDCRIPFLNGGLFEAEYDWETANITIPENLFRNEEKNKAGDKGTGVLDVFDRYNFTIKEDEPLDKEVAVDPEMLGKVFENMLEITERKSKGAFYTPREIVHYMCQESLIHYLDNSLNSSPPFKEEYPKDEVKNSPPSKGGVPEGGGGFNINNLPHLKTFRKNLRNNLTPAEASLWKILQKKQLDGRKFRRQHSVANYILDFYCPSEKLAIELDGQGHFEATQADYDYERDLFLQHVGIKVLRFENKWVWENTEGLIQAIKDEFGWYKKQPPHPADRSSGNEPPRPADTPPLEGGELIRVPKKDIEAYIREGNFALENDQRVANKGTETKDYKYQIPESIRQNADLIDQKLTEIRICDPAIGSGAFPVGLLHELVTAQLVLKPHLSKAYLNKKLDGFGFQFHESINESRYVYRLKRHIIQESIYGVDIDASAIDIARLRLWLSLVVDEDDLDPIETLPNLDYKIVCGNSLIGLPAQGADRYPKLKDELEKLKSDFYDETNENKKKEIKKLINSKIKLVLNAAEDYDGYKIDFDYKLYFSEVWHEKGGFDIVIANPPYISNWSMSKNDRENVILLEKLYKDYLKGHWDIFLCFIPKAVSILKESGLCTFILPTSFFKEKHSAKMREYFVENLKVLELLDFEEEVIFSDVARQTGIFIVENEKVASNSIKVKNGLSVNLRLVDQFFFRELKNYSFKLNVTNEDISIYKKIIKNSDKLGHHVCINTGVVAHSKKGSPVTFKKDDVIFNKIKDGYKPYVVGSDISRFKIIFRGKYIDYTSNSKYFHRPKYNLLFDSPKIIVRRISGKNNSLMACYDENKYYSNDNLMHIIQWSREVLTFQKPERKWKIILNSEFSLKFILSILTSSVYTYFFSKFLSTDTLQGTYSSIYPEDLREAPLKKIQQKEQELLVLLTEYILFVKEKGVDNLIVDYLDVVLDSCVFELYFPEELKSAGKDILKHLGDLKPITDDMSSEEKLAIIQAEYERLYDPSHPVRNAIENLDSIEEVRIIKEALK